MKHRKRLGIQCQAVAMLCVLTVAACAIPGKELPRYTYDQISASAPKPVVSYDAQWLSGIGGTTHSIPQRDEQLQETIEKVFRESDVFSELSAGSQSGEYHLSLVLREQSDAKAWEGIVLLTTGTIIPLHGKFEYTLTVDVKKDDETLKQYIYKDHTDNWVQTLLIFVYPIPKWNPQKVQRRTVENMLLNFLHDLQEDKILAGSTESS